MQGATKIDWIGRNFEILESLCHPLDIIYAVVDKSTQSHHLYSLSHTLFDGPGGVLYLHDQLLGRDAAQSFKKSNKIFKRNAERQFTILEKITLLRQMFIKIFLERNKKIVWKIYNADLKNIQDEPSNMVWHIFTKQETDVLLTKLKQNPTSAAFLSLHKIIKKYLLSNDDNETWRMTVDMRRYSSDKTSTANCLSGFYVDLSNSASYASLNQQILKLLNKNMHWVTWFLVHAIKYLGAYIQKILIKIHLSHFNSIGTFSSYGTHFITDESKLFVGTPPPAPFNPVAAGCGICNEQFYLALRLHPTLMKNRDELQQYCNEWAEELRSNI